jgi:outer membrane protein assembly factor BamE (lipoprotein component of BamABCDE complex)
MMPFMMKKIFLAMIFMALLVSCKHSVPFAYKMDIQQGNMLEPGDVAKIKVGMRYTEVAQILGAPISRDTFKQDSWDYVYYFKRNHEPVEQRHLTVFFDSHGVVSAVSMPESASPPSDQG